MPSADTIKTITRSSPIIETARVKQVRGIFDLTEEKTSTISWNVDLTLPEEWSIGVIVGPSGSGKTTIANEFFRVCKLEDMQWSSDKCVLDDFNTDASIKDIVRAINSVGFASPPSWLRPFHVLSTGEKFRIAMARLIVEHKAEMIVVDEFTSVIDRTVAQISSSAIARTIRNNKSRFVAVTCHYDVIDWLDPDWVFMTDKNTLTRRHLQGRPEIALRIARTNRDSWELFRRHHYLNTSLSKSAHCWVAFIDNSPVAFCAIICFPHGHKPGWRLHRTVCLPDYQGVGIGTALSDYIASIYACKGKPVYSVASHPAIIDHRMRSAVWRCTRKPSQAHKQPTARWQGAESANRLTASFRYCGKRNYDAARSYGIV